VAEKIFNLDRLAELPASLPVDTFRRWVASAAGKFFAAVDHALKSSR